jgi:hypothetical protein
MPTWHTRGLSVGAVAVFAMSKIFWVGAQPQAFLKSAYAGMHKCRLSSWSMLENRLPFVSRRTIVTSLPRKVTHVTQLHEQHRPET